MKTILTKILMIILISLCCGLIINQINPKGIKCHTLCDALTTITQPPISEIAADSAFVFLLQENLQFIDIRSRNKFETEHLPSAISRPFENYINSKLPHIETDKTVILYGDESDSLRIRFMAELLKKHAKQQVLILKGGILSWMDLEFPLEMRMDPEI